MGIEYGRVLYVDLTTRTTREDRVGEKTLRSFLGGSGVATALFLENTPLDAGPLDPANALVFALGPFCGTSVPTSGRHQLVSLSPLTGLFAESDVGGFWGDAFRNTGYDFLVITGASSVPVSLVIRTRGDGSGNVEIESASQVWGKDTIETYDYYKARSPLAETACIGEAGEKLVRIACVSHDGGHARMAGRCGLGAVMGSKKLKAVVAMPERKSRRAVFDAKSLDGDTAQAARELPAKAQLMSTFGTSGTIKGAYSYGDIPIKNWALGATNLNLDAISGQALAENGRLKKKFHCSRCPIGCGRVVELSDGSEGAGAEYETVCEIGSNLMIDNLEAILAANEIANRLGIDTISAGGVIGFLMEAYEKGMTGGLDLSGVMPAWGNAEALVSLMELIGKREGIGALLGEGVARASAVFGHEDFAVHVKGLELPAHDPRAFNALGLSYATGNRGACHLQGLTYSFEKNLTLPEKGFDAVQDRFGLDRKAELTAVSQDYMSVLDSLKLCKFALYGGLTASRIVQWLNLATGWDMDTESLFLAGERIFNLKRLINCARGASRKDDTLPKRIRFEPKGGGAGLNLPPDLDTSLDAYYAFRGWTADGIPSPERLKKLGIFLLDRYPNRLYICTNE